MGIKNRCKGLREDAVLETIDNTLPYFKCNKCEKTFKTKEGQTYHAKNVCVDATFEKTDKLNNHYIQRKSEGNRFYHSNLLNVSKQENERYNYKSQLGKTLDVMKKEEQTESRFIPSRFIDMIKIEVI